MGQARLKMLDSGKPVTFDFSAPEFHIVKGDRDWLAKGDDGQVNDALVVPRAAKFTISSVIKAAFPQGMDRRDGKVWAAWLEVLEDGPETKIDMAKGQVEWLRKHAADESVRVPPSLAQWREALVDYLEALAA